SYENTILFPPNSRVTLNVTLSPATFPSSISVSLPFWRASVPVSFSPSCLSFRVCSMVFPLRSTVHFQVPVALAARAAAPAPSTTTRPRTATSHKALACRLIVGAPRQDCPTRRGPDVRGRENRGASQAFRGPSPRDRRSRLDNPGAALRSARPLSPAPGTITNEFVALFRSSNFSEVGPVLAGNPL